MFYVLNLIAALHARIQRVEDNERGATATEYALLVAFIAVAITVAVKAFGSDLSTFFSGLSTKIGIK